MSKSAQIKPMFSDDIGHSFDLFMKEKQTKRRKVRSGFRIWRNRLSEVRQSKSTVSVLFTSEPKSFSQPEISEDDRNRIAAAVERVTGKYSSAQFDKLPSPTRDSDFLKYTDLVVQKKQNSEVEKTETETEAKLSEFEEAEAQDDKSVRKLFQDLTAEYSLEVPDNTDNTEVTIDFSDEGNIADEPKFKFSSSDSSESDGEQSTNSILARMKKLLPTLNLDDSDSD